MGLRTANNAAFDLEAAIFKASDKRLTEVDAQIGKAIKELKNKIMIPNREFDLHLGYCLNKRGYKVHQAALLGEWIVTF